MELRESPTHSARLFLTCRPLLPAELCKLLHFTTLQPITVSPVAMHKVAIHPSNRVAQSCASRA